LFFRKADKPGWRFLWAMRDQGAGVKDREWLVTTNRLVPQGAAKRPRRTLQEAASWNILRDAMLRIAP
jgi:hypothetical protein